MSFEWIIDGGGPRSCIQYPLLNTTATRALEASVARQHPPGFLMQQAGLALARLSLAVAPHAQRFWIACGRGNNGGDGLEAACHLHRWGKVVYISMPQGNTPLPEDAARALASARGMGLDIHPEPPASWDACIDALLGIGLRDAARGTSAAWIERMNAAGSPVIAADIPSGLLADTGTAPGPCVRATHTLSMLGLKPGLFTHQGRDMCGNIWVQTLGCDAPAEPSAWLNTAPAAAERPHASHKGSFGDVAIVGGAEGMEGAAVLAARAALQSGAGRVYIARLASSVLSTGMCIPADLMQRCTEDLVPSELTAVVGCGGGADIAAHLPRWLAQSRQLVLDADALNAIASDGALRSLLQQRIPDTTVMTPHPLEAARLLGCSVKDVQADRLAAAGQLATSLACTVILKGSGSVIAAPSRIPHINPSGNARLAIAGTGDVLAGMTGAALAHSGSAWLAACRATRLHGALADRWQGHSHLTANGMLDYL